jgi:hypothetical protein
MCLREFVIMEYPRFKSDRGDRVLSVLRMIEKECRLSFRIDFMAPYSEGMDASFDLQWYAYSFMDEAIFFSKSAISMVLE